MKQHIFLAFSLFFLFGCDTDDFLVDSFSDCEQPQRNAIGLQNELLGSWQLKEITCGLCSGEFPKKIKGNLFLTFNTDNTFEVVEDSKNLEVGKWEISMDELGPKISVEVEDGNSQYLPGTIAICNNQLFADLTYLDQLGYLYVKIN